MADEILKPSFPKGVCLIAQLPYLQTKLRRKKGQHLNINAYLAESTN